MAKLLDILAYKTKSTPKNSDGYNDYANIEGVKFNYRGASAPVETEWEFIICEYAVNIALHESPDIVKVKLYDKNPKRKGTLHVQRDPYNMVYVNWAGGHTLIYGILNNAAYDVGEFWVVIERV